MRLLSVNILFWIIFLVFPVKITAHSLYLSVGAGTAAVTLDGILLGYTDNEGVFYSEPVVAGVHELAVEKEGYRSQAETVFVPEGLTFNHIRPLEAFRVIMINELTGREDESVAGPYTIQVGAFSSMENARRMAAGLEGTAHQARVETAEIMGLGAMNRVRIGLFDNFETARETAREYVRSGNRDIWIVGLDGRDWALQLATFSSRDKAAQLVVQVSEPDIYAWIENTPKGMYRVKVGYWADRASAGKAAAGFGERLKLEPLVLQVR
jgi:SPOR domain